MHAALARAAPSAAVIDLCADLPAFKPRAAAYLLPAYTAQAVPGDIVIAVVDPGVGGTRACVCLDADGVLYLGPDNGLLAIVARRARRTRAWALPVSPEASPSFHGRDVFAPAAALLSQGAIPPPWPAISVDSLERPAWPDDLAEIVYVDGYGNAVTGSRVSGLGLGLRAHVGSHALTLSRTFGDVAPGKPLLYVNSAGLLEIAVNGDSAARCLGLDVGTAVRFEA